MHRTDLGLKRANGCRSQAGDGGGGGGGAGGGEVSVVSLSDLPHLPGCPSPWRVVKAANGKSDGPVMPMRRGSYVLLVQTANRTIESLEIARGRRGSELKARGEGRWGRGWKPQVDGR